MWKHKLPMLCWLKGAGFVKREVGEA